MIDLKNSENGKPAPLYDQYENHCRVDRRATRGNATTLKLTCFEFRDDYRAKKNSRRDTVMVTSVDQNRIRINGAAYNQVKKQLPARAVRIFSAISVRCRVTRPLQRIQYVSMNAGKTPSSGGDKHRDNGDNWCKLCRGNLALKIVFWKIHP